MTLSRSEQAAILKADAKRRATREIEELAQLSAIESGRYTAPGMNQVDPYHYSRSIRGVPSNKQRNVRYAETWRATANKAVGTAYGFNPTTGQVNKGQTVKVTAPDGTTSVKPVSAFRSKNIALRNSEHKTQQRAALNTNLPWNKQH